MSLRVNLILEEEQRSGSSLNPKSFLRIATIIVPLIIILLIAQQALSNFMLRSQLNILESQWKSTMPRQKQAVKQTARLNFNIKTKAELDGWSAAHPLWNQILAAVTEAVPASIQLTSLRVSIVEDKGKTPVELSPPVCMYQMSLDGKTAAANSMETVQTLEKNILTHPVIVPLLDTVKVSNFAADSMASNDFSRVFTIQCQFKTLPFKETR